MASAWPELPSVKSAEKSAGVLDGVEALAFGITKSLSRSRRFLVKSKPYTYSSKSTHFNIEVRGADLVVSLLNGKFKATYYKPTGRPHLILRERTRTDDHEMMDEAFRTAVAKARELGWIL